MTPDKTNTQAPDYLDMVNAVSEAAVIYVSCSGIEKTRAKGNLDAAKAALLAEFTRLAALRPAPSPQARPMKLTAKGDSVNLKVWGLDPVLGKDRLFLHYDMIDALVAREIAFRINHFEAPTPSETVTAPVDWTDPGHRLTEAELDEVEKAYVESWRERRTDHGATRHGLECAVRAFLAYNRVPTEAPGTATPSTNHIGDRADLVLERDQLRARVVELESVINPPPPWREIAAGDQEGRKP